MDRLFVVPELAFKDKWQGWNVFLGTTSSRRRSPKEWVPVAEGMAKDNGGLLPCRWWLIRNGLSGLDAAMRKNPALFEHVKQVKRHSSHNSVEKWVSVAEQIAQENGGVVPGSGWRRKNGYKSLDTAIRAHPDAFKHLKQLNRRFKLNP